jgi:hypothetical protein
MAKTKSEPVEKLDVEDTVLIDEAFTVDKARWGTWRSYSKDGKELITSLTEEHCIAATRFYLKGLQEGGFTEEGATYNGEVTGKL